MDVRIKVPRGKILYLGHNQSVDTCPEKFLYAGQTFAEKSHEYFVGYFSSYVDAAEGYARCFGAERGWVNKYIAEDDFYVLDLSNDQIYYDADEVAAEFCPTGGGYYIKWSATSDEYALCNPWKFLKYLGSKKCLKNNKFSEYVCVE